MNRIQAIYGVAKHYAKLMKGYKASQWLEFRKTLSALWRADLYTYTEYQFILGYVYKTFGIIESNAYKPFGTRRIYDFEGRV